MQRSSSGSGTQAAIASGDVMASAVRDYIRCTAYGRSGYGLATAMDIVSGVSNLADAKEPFFIERDTAPKANGWYAPEPDRKRLVRISAARACDIPPEGKLLVERDSLEESALPLVVRPVRTSNGSLSHMMLLDLRDEEMERQVAVAKHPNGKCGSGFAKAKVAYVSEYAPSAAIACRWAASTSLAMATVSESFHYGSAINNLPTLFVAREGAPSENGWHTRLGKAEGMLQVSSSESRRLMWYQRLLVEIGAVKDDGLPLQLRLHRVPGNTFLMSYFVLSEPSDGSVRSKVSLIRRF